MEQLKPINTAPKSDDPPQRDEPFVPDEPNTVRLRSVPRGAFADVFGPSHSQNEPDRRVLVLWLRLMLLWWMHGQRKQLFPAHHRVLFPSAALVERRLRSDESSV